MGPDRPRDGRGADLRPEATEIAIEPSALPARDFIGPVSAADRGNLTALDAREVSGVVPERATKVFIQMPFTRAADTGYNDGYADNVSLLLSGI